jgi:hypothetical protein
LGERSRAGLSTFRGSIAPEAGRAQDVAQKIKVELEEWGLLGEPLGIDIVEPPVLFALQDAGIKVVDGQQLMQQARMVKTQDEIFLLNQACAMVDAAYDELYGALRPGFRENDCVALVANSLYTQGSEFVEGVNAISGERCSPHPHNFSDRALRPGDPAYFDVLHSFNGYRTCYYRTFGVGSASHAMVDAYKRCRDYLDQAIALVRPGATTAEVTSVFPKAQEFGWARRRPVDLGKAGVLAPCLDGPSRGNPGEHGVRAGDVLAGFRRLVGGKDRRADGGDQGWGRDHHALSRRRAARGRQAILHGRRPSCDDARDAVQPEP